MPPSPERIPRDDAAPPEQALGRGRARSGPHPGDGPRGPGPSTARLAASASSSSARGFRRGVESALPLVIVVGLAGGALVAAAIASGASAGGGVVFLISAAILLALGLRLARWSAALGTKRARRTTRTESARIFSRSAWAPWVLAGAALLAAIGAYFVVDPFLTGGRHGAAAIFGVIAAPMLFIVCFYDPLATTLDRLLDRIVGARRSSRGSAEPPGAARARAPVSKRQR